MLDYTSASSGLHSRFLQANCGILDQSQASPMGFTLIELLIVVGIIAVLAAIAVPNFLLAQTRTKVTAGLANMRNIATALEAYRVENGGALPALVMQYGWAERYRFDIPLTTPVPYMTSVPQDPFYRQAGLNGISSGPFYYYAYWLWDHNIIHAVLRKPPSSAPGMWSKLDYGEDVLIGWRNLFLSNFEPAFHKWNHANANFMLRGWGPVYADGHYTYLNPYDPTNGTMSDGEIVFYQ